METRRVLAVTWEISIFSSTYVGRRFKTEIPVLAFQENVFECLANLSALEVPFGSNLSSQAPSIFFFR